jgi:endonuclease/exonuclease/phosphatase family metal-dependent hydrolase
VHFKHAGAGVHDATGFMKIVTWNLCANEFLVDDVSTSVPPDQLADALDREARCLRMLAALETHLDADVLLLQEVMPDECKRICAMFQHHSPTIGPSLSWYGSNQWRSSNVTLIRKPLATDVHTALDGSVFTDRWYYIVDGAQINTSTDDSYAIANVHFDDRDPMLRLRQLHGILRMTDKFKTCIIGGDFNEACRESSELKAALAAHGFKTLCSADTITYTGTDGHDSIDQIAVRGYDRAFHLQCRDYNVAHFTSDHLLLSAVAISSNK